MSFVEYEKEFNLTAQQAYEQTVLWLTAIRAPIKDTNKPFYIKAVHGSFWKGVENPMKRKTIKVNITPLESKNLGVKVHLKATLEGWRLDQKMKQVKQSWDENLFSQLWAVLSKTNHDEILWQIKITQFIHLVPSVENASDFKRFMKKLCQRIKVLNLNDDEVLQITEALKLNLLTAKIFAPTKKEKILQFVERLSKSVLGEALTDTLSGALRGLVEYITN